jgi:hypothetical protein
MKKQRQEVENPILMVLREKKIKKVDLCARAGITWTNAYILSKGARKTVPEAVLKYFTLLGYDQKAIVKQYADFRKYLQSGVM